MSVIPINNHPDYRQIETQHSGGGGGGNMEARIAKIESDVENIKGNVTRMWDDLGDFRKEMRTDFRILWGALFVLAGLMAKGFGWL